MNATAEVNYTNGINKCIALTSFLDSTKDMIYFSWILATCATVSRYMFVFSTVPKLVVQGPGCLTGIRRGNGPVKKLVHIVAALMDTMLK